MPSELDTPQWRSAEHILAAPDPLNAARLEAWHPNPHNTPYKTVEAVNQSTPSLDSLSNPESIIGEALTTAGVASRFMVKMPFAMEMSWGVTALGKALTEYSLAEDAQKNSIYS